MACRRVSPLKGGERKQKVFYIIIRFFLVSETKLTVDREICEEYAKIVHSVHTEMEFG